MELSNVKKLLVKYDEGNTTVEEERLLHLYFNTETVPSDLKEYKTLFAFTSTARSAIYEGELPLGKERIRSKIVWLGFAASILILVGIFTAVNHSNPSMSQQSLGTIEDTEEAYLKARETLLLVSEVLNSGKDELSYVEEFDKAKNKYIKQ